MAALFIKELRSSLISLKCHPLTIILFVLFIVNAVYFSRYYDDWQAYYSRLNRDMYKADEYRMYNLYPSPSVFCCAGNEVQQTVTLWVRLEQLGFWQQNSEKGNIFLPPHILLDWTFIIQVLFSLLMILYSYNLFSEDLEQHTLSLICSNAISRLKIYLGKFLSVLVIAAVTLVTGMILGLITIILLNKIPINTELITRLVFYYLISLIYGTVFILVGAACSILVRRSTISLLVAVSAWLMIVNIIPTTIDITVKHFQKKPGNYELSQMFQNAEMAIYIRLMKLRQRITAGGPYTEIEKQNLIEETRREIVQIGDETTQEERRTSDYILNVHLQRYRERERWKSLMPSALYIHAAERCMNGGNYRFLDFIEQVRTFTGNFQNEIYNRYGIMRSNYSYVFARIGDDYIEIKPEPVKIETHDLELKIKEPFIIDSLLSVMRSMAGLMLFCLIFGIWGFIGFIRCDVR